MLVVFGHAGGVLHRPAGATSTWACTEVASLALMGFLDDAKKFIDEHDDQVDQAIEKAGDLVDEQDRRQVRRPGRPGAGHRRGEDRRRRHATLSGATVSASSRRRTSSCCAPGSPTGPTRCCCSCGRTPATWTATGPPPPPGTSSAVRRRTTPPGARRGRRSASPTSDLTFVTSMQRTQHADPIDERIDFFFTAGSWTGEPRIVEPAKCAALAGSRSTLCPTRWCRTSAFVLERLGTGLESYTTFGF